MKKISIFVVSLFAGGFIVASAPALKSPQFTLEYVQRAQEITPEHWERGRAILAAEGAWLREPIVGAELALVARDVERGEPYAIMHRVPLGP